MLVLLRRKNQTIYIGNEIKITVLGIRGDKVRLGFEADKSVPILRGEIREQIQNSEPVSVDSKPSMDPERGAV